MTGVPVQYYYKDATALFSAVVVALETTAAPPSRVAASVLFDMPVVEVTDKQAANARLIMRTLAFFVDGLGEDVQ